MRCTICLSQYAGSLGICSDCMAIAFPHGHSAWMTHDHQARLRPAPAKVEASKAPAI